MTSPEIGWDLENMAWVRRNMKEQYEEKNKINK
jgi:hypothetical protein